MRSVILLSALAPFISGCVGDTVSIQRYSIVAASTANASSTARRIVKSVAAQYGLIHREYDRQELAGCTRYVTGTVHENPMIEVSLCWSKTPMTISIFESYEGYRTRRHGQLALAIKAQFQTAGLQLLDEKIRDGDR